jgi:hypothetical protein
MRVEVSLPTARLQRPRREQRAGSAGTAVGLIGAAVALLATYLVNADQPIAAPKCALQLSVEVTPDVPNPSDPGFLSSLLGDNAGYQLFLLASVDDTHVNLQLQGPGPAERCQAVVDSMRNDGRVVSIDTS